MEKILYFEITLICIVLLLVVWFNDTRKSRGPVMVSQKLFRILLWTNMGALACDVIQVLFDGTPYRIGYWIENISILGFYLFYSVIAYLFTLYADYELYPDNNRFKKKVIIYAIPAAVMVLMSVLSLWNHWFFRIDETNSYFRGNLFYIPTVFSFGYVLYVFGMLAAYRRKKLLHTNVQRDLYKRLIVFPMIPCICTVLQTLIPGSTWGLPGTTIALLVNYITLQNSYMARDHLTGLYNRSQLENFMNYQLRNLRKGNYFFLILLDLDKFKQINDTYGHVVGDEALIHAAKLLRGSCKRKTDYVARLGGDEFVIIGQCENAETVNMIIRRMHSVADEFNISSKKPYKLYFSAGYVIYDGSTHATLDMLLSEADHKMYDVKKAKKMKEKNN